MKVIVALATLVLLPATVLAQPRSEGKRVYVCGHSFHVMVAAPLEGMARAARIQGHVTVGRSFIGGSTVTQHWEVPDADSEVKKAIRTGKVDVLTLAPHPRVVPDPAIEKFTDLLLAANPRGIVLVQSSWLGFDGHRPGGFSNEDRDQTNLATLRKESEPFRNRLREQIQKLGEAYQTKHKRQVVHLVPVDEAVLRLREQVAQGKVPGIQRQSELFRDGPGHGQPPIAVLVAFCHFAVLYRRSPVGLEVPNELRQGGYGKNAEALNRVLQEIAWKTATEEPLCGLPEKSKK